MEERSEAEKGDEVMLPGFRFHPTDEELVGFYLKRKIQQKPLCIELIRQLDIYKYDPWDLPKLATTGEKEWYFYCPRDRKYRNSARPNRVTGAGFWKATGTDRPIYSGEGTKCIGLKKSLVFYKGRAAKGVKTDWMMHEYRLPSVADSSVAKRSLDKNIPVTESWAICRIFKKANSVAQRALSHSWVSPFPAAETAHGDAFLRRSCTQFGPDNNNAQLMVGGVNNVLQQPVHDYACFDLSTMIYKPIDLAACSKPPPAAAVSSADIPNASFIFTAQDQVQVLSKCPVDVATLLQSLPAAASVLGNTENVTSSSTPHLSQPQQYGGFAAGDLLQEMNARSRPEEKMGIANTRQMGSERTVTSSVPFGLPPNRADGWSSSVKWDHRDISLTDVTAGFSATNKCYT